MDPISIAKNLAINKASELSGQSAEKLSGLAYAGIEAANNPGGAVENFLGFLGKAKDIITNPNTPSLLVEGAEQAVENITEPIVSSIENGAHIAANEFSGPLLSDETTKIIVSILIVSRNIIFFLIVSWSIILTFKNYTTFLTVQQKEYVETINTFIHNYSGIIIALVVIWLLFVIPIYGLPLLGKATNLFTKVNNVSNIILKSI